jgi:predicted secreted acid phosphatase
MPHRCAWVAILALLSGWLSAPAAAETPLGCDKVSGLPVVDYLVTPQNLALLKQQLLIYRCQRYDSEIAMVVQEALAWVKLRAAQVSNPAIVLDIDETSLSNWNRIYQDEYYPFTSACDFTQKCSDKDWQWTEQAPAVGPVLDLYKFAQCIDVASPCTKVDVYFVTGRHEGDKYAPKEMCPDLKTCDPSLVRSPREWTLANLQKAGFTGVTSELLYMRAPVSPGEPRVSIYKTEQRIKIEQIPKAIIANVGDQNSDLVGLHAERTFKLPNPFYFIP